MSEDTLRETFCKNLSRILKERKMTQRDFAKAVGVSAATANEWLKGKKMPLMGRIDTICSVLSIDRSDLMAAPAPPAAQPPTAPYRTPLTERDERDIMISASSLSPVLNEEEREHLRKYRSIDDAGRKIVDGTLDTVYRMRQDDTKPQ